MSRFIKNLNIAIEIGWLMIFGLSPLYFSLWVYGVWQVGEYFLFQSLTEIIFFLWLLKIINSKNLFKFNKEIFIFYLKRLLPAIIFIFILGLSTFFSQAPHYSFWGSYSRKIGYLIWLHAFAFFLVLFFNLKKNIQIKRIFYTILGTTSIVVVYGFLQILNMDPLHWAEPAFIFGRIFSTLGQPNFLASWLLLSIPVVIWELLMVEKRKNRQSIFQPLIIILLLLSIFSLALTQSRGGWIGFFFLFFFFAIIFSLLIKQKRLANLLIILLIVIIGGIAYLNYSPYKIKSSYPLINRFLTLENLKEAGKIRLITWTNAIDLIKKKPILGYGLETQRFNFVHYYQPESAILETINSYPDRAHNDILDTTLTSGFLGLVSYLFFIGSAFYFGFKNLRESSSIDEKIIILVILSGLIGYLVSIQFSFHVIPTLVYFWGYLAIILGSDPKNLRLQTRINTGV